MASRPAKPRAAYPAKAAGTWAEKLRTGAEIARRDRFVLPCAPRILSIDEVYLTGRREPLCLITNPERPRRYVLEVLPSAREGALTHYLSTLVNPDNVEAICIDLSTQYAKSVRKVFPCARLVADRFHVDQITLRAFRQARNQFMAELPAVDRQRIKAILKVLEEDNERLKNRESAKAWRTERSEAIDALISSEWGQMRAMLREYPPLERMWKLREGFRLIAKALTREEAEQRHQRWCREIEYDDAQPFQTLLKTSSYWQEAIMNYYDYPITNGFIEGQNKRLKQVHERMREGAYALLRAKMVYHFPLDWFAPAYSHFAESSGMQTRRER